MRTSSFLPFSNQGIVGHFQGNKTGYHQDRQDLKPTDGITEDDPCQNCRNYWFEEKQVIWSLNIRGIRNSPKPENEPDTGVPDAQGQD